MSIINTNTISLNAQRNLSSNSASLATTIQRLSSGLRINSARDDAAGLAISERFSTQIRGLNQAARNANDGISLAQTAEGALGEISSNLQRIRELAVQSRNATNSQTDRNALQAEVSQLKSEIDRVASQTSFNGLKLLDGSFTAQAFQVGADQGQTILVNAVVDANINALGSWTSVATPATVTGAVLTGGASAATGGSITATTGYPPSFGVEQISFDVDGTPVTLGGDYGDLVGLAAGVEAQLSGYSVRANDLGLLVITKTATGSGSIAPVVSNWNGDADGNNTFLSPEVFDGAIGIDGLDAVPATFANVQFSINGTTISVTAQANATAQAEAVRAAINAQTGTTGVAATVSGGALTLTAVSGTGDINIGAGTGAGNDAAGILAATGLTVANNAATPGTAQTGFAGLDISSITGADNAILAMDAALSAVNSARADLGAIQNRFSSVISNLNTTSENLAASRSRIRDADYAKETAELTRTQILQQAGTAMLAQANQIPQNVLSLLR